MTTYYTGNPLGSSDPRDLYDNAENLDQAMNKTGSNWTDRLGRTRKTFQAAENAADAAEAAADQAINTEIPAEVQRTTNRADTAVNTEIPDDVQRVEDRADYAVNVEIPDEVQRVEDEGQAKLDAAEVGWETRFVAGQDQRADLFAAAQDDRHAQFAQLMVSGGYEFLGDYTTGMEITAYKQIVRDGGEFWRPAANTALPYTTTGAGMPEGGAFVNIGDGLLRQDLVQPVATFNNVADMVASGGLDVGRKVRTLGYYTPGDGGGNDYEIVAAGTGTADGGSFIDLSGSELQAKGLFPSGVWLEQFGAQETGEMIDVFKAAGAYAAATGVLYLSGSYAMGDWWLDYPSGLSMVGVGRAEITDSHIRLYGSIGSEIALTAAVAAGDRVIPLSDTSALSSGDWIRLVSCINSNSPDAGDYALGNRTLDNSYLSEYVQIDSVDAATQVTLRRGTLFPYSDTPGPDSGSRTESVAYPMTFHEGASFHNIRFNGIHGPQAAIIQTQYAKDVYFDEKCSISTLNDPYGCIQAFHSINVTLDGTDVEGPTNVSGDPTANLVKFVSCQDSFIKNGANIRGGNQSIDVTYRVNSSEGGGPSINCGAVDTYAYGAGVELYSDHPGTWGTKFNRNTAIGCLVSGIRVRGRNVEVIGNKLTGQSDGVSGNIRGVIIQGMFTAGCQVKDNHIENFYRGVSFSGGDSVGDFNVPTGDGVQSFQVVNNVIIKCDYPIFCASPATAYVSSRLIVDNTIIEPGQEAIYILEYVNGCFIDGNSIYGHNPGNNFRGAIALEGNATHITVGDRNQIFCHANSTNASALRGPIASGGDTFISDLTTFPGGDAEANLRVGTLSISGGFSVILSRMGVSRDVYAKEYTPGLQPFIFSLSNTAISLAADLPENGTASLYLEEASNELRAQVRLSDGTTKSFAIGTWT